MDVVTYPLNNIDYSAEDAELFHCTRTSGIFASEEDFLASVTGLDNYVTVNQGIAWIRNSRFSGKVVANKSSVAVDMGLADGAFPRIDAVVLQFDANKNKTSILKKNGVASSNPIPPEVVRTEAVYELHLYHVYRRVGATSISESDITDLRQNSDYCGIMSDDVTEYGGNYIEKNEKGSPNGIAPLNNKGFIEPKYFSRNFFRYNVYSLRDDVFLQTYDSQTKKHVCVETSGRTSAFGVKLHLTYNGQNPISNFSFSGIGDKYYTPGVNAVAFDPKTHSAYPYILDVYDGIMDFYPFSDGITWNAGDRIILYANFTTVDREV